MRSDKAEVVVAGHTCLDIIPTFEQSTGNPLESIASGRNMRLGPLRISTGGAVSNTGLSLHRLGETVRLVGKIGDDLVGRTIVDVYRRHDPALAEDMIVAPGEASSYSIVISAPKIDRVFLHCLGTNDTFSADDITDQHLAGARVFHIGYPPVMRKMTEDGGRKLAALLRRARQMGIATSLDMAQPSLQTDEVEVDWAAWLRRVMAEVDILLPSLEETLFMFDRDALRALLDGAAVSSVVDGARLSRVGQGMLDMGVAVAGLKLGDQGLYLCTTDDRRRLAAVGGNLITDLTAWCGRELFVPCFVVDVTGTTGTGDAACAGLLSALLHGCGPEMAIQSAAGAGACAAEQVDATSGVPPWQALEQRIAAGWPQRAVALPLPGWTWDADYGIWRDGGDGA